MIVIVLGQELSNSEIHDELQGRLEVGINLFNQKDIEYIILCGGNTDIQAEKAESEAMKEFVSNKGIDPENILIEKYSKGTIGNAYFTRRLLCKKDLENFSDIFVITSCYHTDRVEYIFSQVYGEEFKIHTNYCYDGEIRGNIQKKEEEERESMRLAENFFSDIKKGNYKKVGNKLQDWFQDVEL
jgi:uncharacterized SAM-binding protein YcdF (DUF218 family)